MLSMLPESPRMYISVLSLRYSLRNSLFHRNEWLSKKSGPASIGYSTWLLFPSYQALKPLIVSASTVFNPNFLSSLDK